MDLKKITVSVEEDGFRLQDQQSGLEIGAALEARYEISSGWQNKIFEWEPDPPTLFHPFRKAMFVYTGEPPTRVLVRLAGTSQPFQEIVDRDRFYQEANFSSYPVFHDPLWNQGGYSDFFFPTNPIFTPPPMAFVPPPVESDSSPDSPTPGERAPENDIPPDADATAAAPQDSAVDSPPSSPEILLEDPEPSPPEPNAY